jgi:hypothetical protein
MRLSQRVPASEPICSQHLTQGKPLPPPPALPPMSSRHPSAEYAVPRPWPCDADAHAVRWPCSQTAHPALCLPAMACGGSVAAGQGSVPNPQVAPRAPTVRPTGYSAAATAGTSATEPAPPACQPAELALPPASASPPPVSPDPACRHASTPAQGAARYRGTAAPRAPAPKAARWRCSHHIAPLCPFPHPVRARRIGHRPARR